jgi:hypothetical protein
MTGTVRLTTLGVERANVRGSLTNPPRIRRCVWLRGIAARPRRLEVSDSPIFDKLVFEYRYDWLRKFGWKPYELPEWDGWRIN